MLRFSVIVPFRNAAKTLPEAIASLQAQTVPDWEGLFIDDGSSDGSTEMVRQAATRDPRVRPILERVKDERVGIPRGVAATRNLGLAAARGDFVAFLDADDRWLPEKLSRQAVAFDAGAEIVFSSYRRIDAQGRTLGTVTARPRVTWETALYGNPIGCLTGAYRRRRFVDARMPLRPMHEDYAFWLTLLRDGAVAHGLPEVLAEYRIQPGSASSDKLRAAAAVWDVLRTQGVPLHRRLCGFLGYVAGSVRKRI